MNRCTPGMAVWREPPRALESANGRGRVRSVAAVDADGVAAAPEHELERRHVPAAAAEVHHAAAERGRPVPPEGAAGARSRDPVSRQAVPVLEGPHRAARTGAGDAVDAAAVVMERA